MTEQILQALSSNDFDELKKLLEALPSGTSGKKDPELARQARQSKYIHKKTKEHQDIGFPPAGTIDWSRREPAEGSLQSFLETYFPNIFTLEWSEDHLRLIDKLERAIINGELSALAMPRGSGKTSITQRAGLWALLNGHRKYVVILAATETSAQRLLRSLKSEILYNEALKQDYAPELHCMVSLGNRAALANGQHCNGELTGVEWNVGHVNFGHIDFSHCGIDYGYNPVLDNSMLKTMGITGNIRGEQITTIGGEIRRPDLVLVDDPSTKSSSASANQNNKRHETLMGDVLGMAGPGKSIAGLCAMTVIYANDLADRLLDPEQSPEWQGERCKLVYKWPENMKLWDEYQTRYEEELRQEIGHEGTKKFILDNFDEMHEGSVVGWPARYDKRKEVSALHHAFNLKIRDAGAFAAEYQNEPLEGFDDTPFDLNAETLSRRIVPNHKRNEVPDDVETITAAIDVQKRLLYYMVCGWTASSKCYILDYGNYPDQRRTYFVKRDAPRTMQDEAQTEDLDDALRFALENLTDDLFTREYDRGLSVEKVAIDARWGDSTEIIRRFCRESKYKTQMHPSMGVYIGANSRKWQKMRLGKYDKKGVHAKLQPPSKGVRGRPELLIDTNFWKTFVASRLSVSPSSNRSIVLFEASPTEHRMLAEHLSSELPKKVTGKSGEVVTEWDSPNNQDNDWWDCLVYNCALASVIGVKTHTPGKGKRIQNTSRTSPSKQATKGPGQEANEGRLSARERMERRRRR